jgi:acetyltransferase
MTETPEDRTTEAKVTARASENREYVRSLLKVRQPRLAAALESAAQELPRDPRTQVLPGELYLRDGTPALIWPLLPTDAETLRELFGRLSPESRRRRFLGPLGELDDTMIQQLVGTVDGMRHIALLLLALPPDGPELTAGVARLIQYPADPATADIAFAVADDWQGRGVGAALVTALMQRRPAAVRRLRTAVEADNRASLALLARAGRVSRGVSYLGVVDVTVELTAA